MRDRTARAVAPPPLRLVSLGSTTHPVTYGGAWGRDNNLSIAGLGDFRPRAGPPAPPSQPPWQNPFCDMLLSQRWLTTEIA